MVKKVKKLCRAKEKDSMIAGVCAGFAEYVGMDVSLMRLIWALCVFLGGFGILAYILSWIIIPRK